MDTFRQYLLKLVYYPYILIVIVCIHQRYFLSIWNTRVNVTNCKSVLKSDARIGTIQKCQIRNGIGISELFRFWQTGIVPIMAFLNIVDSVLPEYKWNRQKWIVTKLDCLLPSLPDLYDLKNESYWNRHVYWVIANSLYCTLGDNSAPQIMRFFMCHLPSTKQIRMIVGVHKEGYLENVYTKFQGFVNYIC